MPNTRLQHLHCSTRLRDRLSPRPTTSATSFSYRTSVTELQFLSFSSIKLIQFVDSKPSRVLVYKKNNPNLSPEGRLPNSPSTTKDTMHDAGLSAGHPNGTDSDDHYTLQLESSETLHYSRLESTRLAGERRQTSLPDWNRYMANYKIDYRSFTLPAFARNCLTLNSSLGLNISSTLSSSLSSSLTSNLNSSLTSNLNSSLSSSLKSGGSPKFTSGQPNAQCSVARADQRRCLISCLFAWLLVAASLAASFTNAQTLSPNAGPNFQTPPTGATYSQSPRTVATKYGIVRGTIITLPNLNLQQVEAFLGR